MLGRGSSLRTKLGIALLLVALVPMVTTGALLFRQQRQDSIDERLELLAAIGTVQQRRVEAWVDSSEDGLALIASRTRLRVLQREVQEPGIPAAELSSGVEEMSRILSDAKAASQNVLDAHALDRGGAVLASTDPTLFGADLSDEPYVLAATLGRPSLSHVALVGDELAGLHAGVMELDGQPIGWLVIQHRWQPLLDVLTDPTGLGQTGEALLVRRDPFTGDIISLGPLRGRSEAALQPVPTADQANLIAERALQATPSNAMNATDYRGKAVAAATRPIDGTDWGLAVKQDRAEILAVTNSLRNTLMLAVGLMATLAVIAAWLVAHQLTKHIKELTTTALRISGGDRSARAGIHTRDELSELAVAFNRMADDLVGHEQELETRKTQLESFLYVSSHDLKTPLRSVSSFSQLLRLDYGADLDERATHYLQRIEVGATRTIDVIDDLLAYVRVDHNHHERTVVDITATAIAARELLASSIAESRAEVTIDDLGRIDGNQALLVQLFQNLIGNAVKYAKPDVAPVVTVSKVATAGANGDTDPSWGSQDRTLSFEVADNGVGVPEQFRLRVFAPFERLQSTDAVPGTGLGLAVCERIVALHNGTIEFVDSPLGGAAVRITLTPP